MNFGTVLGGAFLGGLGDRMKENREYTKTKGDEMRAFLVQTGLKRKNEVAAQRKELNLAYDWLDSKDMNKDIMLSMLDENPRELIRLYKIAYKAESKMPINGAILDSAATVADSYTSSGKTASELLAAATPDFITGAEITKPDQVERNMFSQMFKSPNLEEIMQDAYMSDILGVKGKDIQASISAPLITNRKGDKVTTDMSVFNILDPSEIRENQSAMLKDYNLKVKEKLEELRKESASIGDDPNRTSELIPLQIRIMALEGIEDIRNTERKEKMEAMLTNKDIGFDIANSYFKMNSGNSFFVNQPSFIDKRFIPYISGDETYVFDEPSNQEPSDEGPEPDVQVDEIPVGNWNLAPLAAVEWFKKDENEDKIYVELTVGEETRVFQKIVDADGKITVKEEAGIN